MPLEGNWLKLLLSILSVSFWRVGAVGIRLGERLLLHLEVSAIQCVFETQDYAPSPGRLLRSRQEMRLGGWAVVLLAWKLCC